MEVITRMNPKKNIRDRLISWQQHRLFMPRFQMILILSLTGSVGFLASFLLLHIGVDQMWMRYPLAILSAYVAFLLLLRLWLALYLSSGTLDLGVKLDSPAQSNSVLNEGFDLPADVGSGSTSAFSTNFSFGGGGDFGGAGAGGSWGDSVSSSSSSSGDNSNSDFGLVILAVVVLIGGIMASLYIIYIAPVLLAEMLVDGILVRGLYKRVGHIERKHWLQTAIRKTMLPALLCIVLFGTAGFILQIAVPDAKSIGEVWHELRAPKPVN